ncbi:hypothetical protein WG66_007309, partial [Moniliophthora roreri]
VGASILKFPTEAISDDHILDASTPINSKRLSPVSATLVVTVAPSLTCHNVASSFSFGKMRIGHPLPDPTYCRSCWEFTTPQPAGTTLSDGMQAQESCVASLLFLGEAIGEWKQDAQIPAWIRLAIYFWDGVATMQDTIATASDRCTGLAIWIVWYRERTYYSSIKTIVIDIESSLFSNKFRRAVGP